MRMILLALLLSGCATSDGYKAYLSAQQQANVAALKAQKPMLRITAQPGQPITGLASIEVFGPMQLPQVQQERPNEWAAVVQSGLGVVGLVGGIVAAGKAAEDLSDSAGRNANYGYKYTQGPVDNSWRIDNTHPAQVVNPVVVPQPTQVVNPVVVTQPPPQIIYPVVVP